MPRIRKEHKEGFTTIGNELIQNAALSWKARGLMIYLLSMPQDWDFNLADLANRAPEGKSALRSGVAELEEHGYIHIIQERNPSGKWDGWTWYVYEDPMPRSENPISVNPKSENPPLQKKQSTKETETKGTSAPALAPPGAPQATPDENGIYTASIVDESDEQVTCPACGEPVIVARQPNTQGICPHCEAGLRIMDPHGATRKKGKKKLLTLEIFADCPPALAHVKVPGEHVDDLKRAHAADPTYVWEAIRWAAGKVAEGNMQANVMVRAAVGWALKRLDAAAAASGEAPSDLETVPLPELRARLAGGELRMDDLDAGEQAVVLARLGALP